MRSKLEQASFERDQIQIALQRLTTEANQHLQNERASRVFADNVQAQNDQLREEIAKMKLKLTTIAMQPAMQGI